MSGIRKEKIDKFLYAIAGGYLGYFVIHPVIISIYFAMQTGQITPVVVLMTAFSYRMIPWAMTFTFLGAGIGYLYGSIKENMAEMVYSNRTKELFIDILHHDLASPISSAKMNIELFMRNKNEEHLHYSLRSLDEMWNIIEDSRDLAKLKITVPRFEEMDLTGVVEETVDEYLQIAEKENISLKFSSKDHFPVMAARTIKLAIGNLISNAIRYSPEGSTVEISVIDERKNYVIAISDQGTGIPDKKKEIIFERFERIETGLINGFGLGLAIVKRIAEIHRGRVWVEDNKPKGSVFKLIIPKNQ